MYIFQLRVFYELFKAGENGCQQDDAERHAESDANADHQQ